MWRFMMIDMTKQETIMLVSSPSCPGDTPEDRLNCFKNAVNVVANLEGEKPMNIGIAIGTDNGVENEEEVYLCEVITEGHIRIVLNMAKFESQDYVLVISPDRKVGKFTSDGKLIEMLGKLRGVYKAEAEKIGAYTRTINGHLYWTADNERIRLEKKYPTLTSVMDKYAGRWPEWPRK
jgi:hypothetical protein